MQEKDFITYEYCTKKIKAEKQAYAADMYEAFGWEITSVSTSLPGTVTLSMKRDRKLPHKPELNKLERQAENTLDCICRFEKAKTCGATIFSFIFGIAAALILGGGMSMVMLLSGPAAVAVGVVLGVVGIALCCVNYPIFKKLVEKKTGRLLPVIDDSEEQLANLLGKGSDLLSDQRI